MTNRFALKVSVAAVALAAVANPLSAARAQNFERVATGITDTLQTALDFLPEEVTNIRIGVGPALGTDYEGSDHYQVDPIPVISLRYKNFLEVDNNEVKLIAFRRLFDAKTGSPDDGGQLRVGPLVSIDFGRGEDSPDLRGMGTVSTSFELGAFVSYTIGKTRARIRARHDIVSGHNGAKVQFDVSRTFIRAPKYTLGGAVSGTWVSGPYMRSYFGVSPAQAAATGYPVFQPGAGFKDVSFSLNANYLLSQQWSLVASAGYERLLGKAADSPIVSLVGSPNQMSLTTFIVYSF
jgi:outer membrane protein